MLLCTKSRAATKSKVARGAGPNQLSQLKGSLHAVARSTGWDLTNQLWLIYTFD
jgi:hypothetical protein